MLSTNIKIAVELSSLICFLTENQHQSFQRRIRQAEKQGRPAEGMDKNISPRAEEEASTSPGIHVTKYMSETSDRGKPVGLAIDRFYKNPCQRYSFQPSDSRFFPCSSVVVSVFLFFLFAQVLSAVFLFSRDQSLRVGSLTS